MAFAPPPKPNSPLGYHRILAPTAGVRVSPLCLGTMNFGESWKEMMGECDKETAFKIMDYFWEQGGNFLDTANNYQQEESETWIGEWMKERGNRDQMVIATKFTTFFPGKGKEKTRSNYQGNHTKSLHLSLEASLKKLQTSYIDLVVAAGKVLYLGISDTPAWVVSKANEYARNHGLRQFSVYQGRWSAADRDFEREILPMCHDEGMALAPWGALGGGNFKTEEQRKSQEGRKMRPASEKDIKVSKALEKIANQKGTIITSVALAYVMAKSPYVFPIVGGRKLEHLKGNIQALTLKLSDEEVQEIDDSSDFDVGFPMSFLFQFGGEKYNTRMTTKDIGLVKAATHLDTVEPPRPIKPHKSDE